MKEVYSLDMCIIGNLRAIITFISNMHMDGVCQSTYSAEEAYLIWGTCMKVRSNLGFITTYFRRYLLCVKCVALDEKTDWTVRGRAVALESPCFACRKSQVQTLASPSAEKTPGWNLKSLQWIVDVPEQDPTLVCHGIRRFASYSSQIWLLN